MTREEILSLPAGRELDALVAKRVMRWTWASEWYEKGIPDWLPHYSSEIAAAWEIVEKLVERGWYFEIRTPSRVYKTVDITWHSRIRDAEHGTWDRYGGDSDGVIGDDLRAETLPLAVCRAALLAVMESE